jgi:hypothetical protein
MASSKPASDVPTISSTLWILSDMDVSLCVVANGLRHDAFQGPRRQTDSRRRRGAAKLFIILCRRCSASPQRPVLSPNEMLWNTVAFWAGRSPRAVNNIAYASSGPIRTNE